MTSARRASFVFLACFAFLAAALLTNVVTVGKWDKGLGGRGGGDWDENAAILTFEVFVEPGDIIRIPPAWRLVASPSSPPSSMELDFLVVEGGEGDLLLDAPEAPHTYVHQPAPLEQQRFELRRPQPPADKPSNILDGWSGRPDERNGIELVWRLRPGTSTPAEFRAVAKDFSEQNVLEVFSTPLVIEHVSLIDGGLYSLQPGLYLVQGLAGMATVIAGGAWWRARRAGQVSSDNQEPPSLVGLITNAQDYIRSLLLLLRLVGALLALVVLLGLSATMSFEAGLYERGVLPSETWGIAMVVGFGLVGAAALAFWWGHYRTVAAELRRWSSKPPPSA